MNAPHLVNEATAAAQLFLHGIGQAETRAVTLSDGKPNPHPHAGQPYLGISGREIAAMVRDPAAVAKDAALWCVPSTYRGPDGRSHDAQRAHGAFWWLALDCDRSDLPLEDVAEALEAAAPGASRLIYSTRSSKPGDRRWRALVPLARPIPGVDYSDTATAFYDRLEQASGGVLIPDRALSRPGQLVYLPNRGEYYAFKVHHAKPADLTPDHPIVQRREASRAARAAAECEAAEARRQRAERRREQASEGESPVDLFNSRHTVAQLLDRYGYRPGGGDDWRSPMQQSGSFATRDYSDHWISLSGSDAVAGIGAATKNRHRWGDAFDLFVHFEHGGDFSTAVRAYAEEAGLDRPSKPDPRVWVRGSGTRGGDQHEVSGGDPRAGLRLSDWTAARFRGDPPPIRWLIEDVLPLGVPGMVAAMGDTGKSFALLDLAAHIATGPHQATPPIFGGQVVAHGTAAILTAEDDAGAVHRRIAALGEIAPAHAARLIVVPLPDAGGPLPLFMQARDGYATTPAWDLLRADLAKIPDLVLGVLDPLQAFALVPINEDPAAGQFVCSALATLAAETGATILVAHHMRKASKPITTLQDARDAIRGSTALVDGLRWAFAMWPAEDATARKVCAEIGRYYAPNAIVQGGVVKANGPTRREVRSYSRQANGLLRDVTVRAGAAVASAELLAALAEDVERAALIGHAFTHTGEAGLYKQRRRLTAGLCDLSRHRIEGLAQELLNAGRIVKCVGPHSSVPKFLDLPSGPYARGEAEVTKGAAA